MKIHKPTIFFLYGLLVGLGVMALCRSYGNLWGVLIIPAMIGGVWLDVKTTQI